MDINIEIWGDDTQRHTFNADNTPSRGECEYSTEISTIQDYSTEYGLTEPIDNSINLWQVGDKSDINATLYLRRDGNDNLIQDVCRAPKPHTIMLVAPGYNMSNNSKFNQNAGVNSTCQIWSEDNICNFPYKSGSGRHDYIVTNFNYNGIAARFTLFVQKHDSANNRTGSESQVSIYQYWFGDDGNGDSYKDNYYINAMSVSLCVGNDTTRYTAFGGSYNYPPIMVCNTQYATPTPNYFYDQPYFYNYTVNNTGNTIFYGLRQMAYTGVYQQGAYSTGNNAFGGMFWGANWVIDDYYIGTSHYISGRFTGDYDEMLKQCAFLGFWFDESQLPNTGGSFVIGESCNDNHVILPEIIGGRTTGNFLRGTQAGTSPQATWGNDWRENVGYTGDNPYGGDTGDTGDLISIFNRPIIAGTSNYYSMFSTTVRELADYINSGYQPTDAEFINDFKGVNPADYISSCIYYPDGLACPTTDDAATGVSIGALSGSDTGITAKKAKTWDNYINFGAYTIYPYFNDFRDYAPYTTLDLYIPFCGNIELDTAVFVGHTLTTFLLIDYPTGNCTGVVMCDSMVYDTINGTCGVSVPLTAQNMGSWQNSIKSAEIALKQAELQRKTAWLAAAGSGVSLVAGVATMNPLAIAGGVGGLIGGQIGIEKANLAVENAQYQLSHTAPATRSISTSSPANGLCLDYDCHLLIKRPVMTNGFNDLIYSHTVGNACAINDTLSNFSGLVVCADADLSGITGPVEIKTAILSALKSGVYI